MKRIIQTELSALGIRKASSPRLKPLIARLAELQDAGLLSHDPLIVDQGCGQLRITKELLKHYHRIVVVETDFQLSRKHKFFDEKLTIPEFLKLRWSNHRIEVMSSTRFAKSQLRADVVFSVNVLDVTPPHTRGSILRAARQNISQNGVFAVIVPKNESWTLRLCTKERKHADGFVFSNHRAHTFYKNWQAAPLRKLLKRYGFLVWEDLSRFRIACLICKPC
ncbi:MAG: methyltransferase domain-containing protein [Verrucomicrobia bacterium]|nr:methyltransferase domain-containing protein [Verrucomicrobiota bacterium]